MIISSMFLYSLLNVIGMISSLLFVECGSLYTNLVLSDSSVFNLMYHSYDLLEVLDVGSIIGMVSSLAVGGEGKGSSSGNITDLSEGIVKQPIKRIYSKKVAIDGSLKVAGKIRKPKISSVVEAVGMFSVYDAYLEYVKCFMSSVEGSRNSPIVRGLYTYNEFKALPLEEQRNVSGRGVVGIKDLSPDTMLPSGSKTGEVVISSLEVADEDLSAINLVSSSFVGDVSNDGVVSLVDDGSAEPTISDDDIDNSFAKLAVDTGMYVGSYDKRLSAEMRPFVKFSVESITGVNHVVWDLSLMEDRMVRLLKAVESRSREKKMVMIVCTHGERSNVCETMFESVGNVRLVTKKWLNGMLSNYRTLRELALKYRVTPGYEVTKASHDRFDRYIAPIEDFLKGNVMPSRVIFVNAHDHVTSIREVYNMGIPVAALCDVDCSWYSMVDYPIPFPSLAESKSGVVVSEQSRRDTAQGLPLFMFIMMVRMTLDSSGSLGSFNVGKAGVSGVDRDKFSGGVSI